MRRTLMLMACSTNGIAVLAVGMFFPWLKASPVPALTDQEAQHLLEESQSDFGGLSESHESAYAETRTDD